MSTDAITEGGNPPNGYVASFGRGLAVIRCFAGTTGTLTISDVARATGLNRATARRFVHTLETDGYLRADGPRYSLRPKVLELGYSYLSSVPVDEIFQRLLEELADRLHEPCSAAVLDDHDVVFVARAHTRHPRVMTLALSVGSRLPARLSAIGRVLLAELDPDVLDERLRTDPRAGSSGPDPLRAEIARVRDEGFCVVDQESEPGVLAAAVPVRRPLRPTVGISVALHSSRGTVGSLRSRYVPVLQETAAELEHALWRRY